MADPHPHALLIILFVAALAPLLNELPIRLRLPLVVLELTFGMIVGPQGLDLVAAEGSIRTLSALGLSFLFFLAGMHIDFAKLRGPPLALGARGWVMSVALALCASFALARFGVVSDPIWVALALSTTAIGTLLPILREAGELDRDFGLFVLGAGAMAEFGPIVLCTLLIAGEGELVQRSGYLATFLFVVLACSAVALRLRPPHVVDLLARTLHRTSQLPIRLSMLILGACVVLADVMGLDLLLGAFAAGSLVGLVSRGADAELFHHKLDALGFGFLIPIFFVVSGTQVDLRALCAGVDSLARVPLYLLLLLLVRGLPAWLLYRRDLTSSDRSALACYSATTLPLVVVIAHLGMAGGRMRPENGAALVGAGIASVVLFPLIAFALRRRRLATVGS